jgi:chitinase
LKVKRRVRGLRFVTFFFLLLVFSLLAGSFSEADAQSDVWVSAYYAGWMQGCGYGEYLTADQIDFDALTHVLHFSIMPNRDGSIDDSINCISPDNSADIVTAAHNAGKKVLISVGCWGTESDFLSATSSANRTKFINNLIDFMVTRGYDGIDVDWEPLSSSSVSQFRTFITELRDALDTITPRPLLTAAVLWEPAVFSQLQDKFDQINIMTYELSGPWPGWITWHNAPVYDGGYWFPSTGEPVPSGNELVDDFLSAGIHPSKLGIGIEFYGAVWSGGSGTTTGGVTEPGQSWTDAPSREMIPYYEVMDTYYQSERYRWDDAALAPYLSIDEYGSTNDKFISYDDETSCYEKINYVRNKGIGGVIVFELGAGWRPTEPVPDSLLKSIKDAVGQDAPVSIPLPPTLVYPQNGATDILLRPTLTWDASPGADFYAVQVSTDPGFSNDVHQRNGITDTSFQLTTLLSESTTYYWRVRASNSSGASEWSDAWNFTTVSAMGTVISFFTAEPISSGILLSWQTTSEYNNKGFIIERRNEGSTRWRRIKAIRGAGTTTDTTDYTFVDYKVRDGRTYVYRLKQVNRDGTYTYTQEVNVQK